MARRLSSWLVLAALGAAPAIAQPDPASLAARVLDAGLPGEARADAARALVQLPSGEAIARARALLADRDAVPLVLRGLALASTPPPELEPSILALAESGPTPEWIAALVPFRSRSAARAILTAAQAPALLAPATDALSDLSGEAFGHDLPAWEAWLGALEHVPEAQWNRALATSLAASAERQRARADLLARRLVASIEQGYRSESPEHRPGVLAAILRDDIAEVRSLGFRLVGEELEDGRAIAAPVVDALLSLLRHPEPDVRARAGLMVDRAAPIGTGPAVLDALSRESRPEPASALLRAAARFPTPGLEIEALRWLETGTEAAPAAIDALLSLQRAGMITQGARILASLASRGPEGLTPSSATLLLELGGERERAIVRAALAGSIPGARLAAAGAGWKHADFFDDLLASAAADPHLSEFAARAVWLRPPSIANFRSLESLAYVTEEARRATLSDMARALATSDLISLSLEPGRSPEVIDLVLSPVVAQDRGSSSPDDPSLAQAIADSGLRLARARLDLDRPDAALVAVRQASELHEFIDVDRARSLRVTALLMLGRVDEASEAGASIESWIEGLERCLDEPFAIRIVERARLNAWPDASPDQRARWQRMADSVER